MAQEPAPSNEGLQCTSCGNRKSLAMSCGGCRGGTAGCLGELREAPGSNVRTIGTNEQRAKERAEYPTRSWQHAYYPPATSGIQPQAETGWGIIGSPVASRVKLPSCWHLGLYPANSPPATWLSSYSVGLWLCPAPASREKPWTTISHQVHKLNQPNETKRPRHQKKR
jgi:hypothetical protein